MEFRRLGRSGLVVSEIAYGNWITHGSQVEQDAASACVRAALDEGVTFFDTADVYAQGRAELALAAALKGERRSSYVLATKVFWPTGELPTDKGLSRKHIVESCHASLQRLETDYVDLYQAHRYDPNTPLDETLRAFDDLVRAGKVLYVGISEWPAERIAEALSLSKEMGLDQIVSSQPQYSMIWRTIEHKVVPVCRDGGISQIVWSPIAQGVLSGKYAPGQPPPAGTRGTDETGGASNIAWLLNDHTLTKVQALRPIAEEVGLSMAALAVAWVLQNDNVAAAIIGASRPEQVVDNCTAAGVTLSDDVMKSIDVALEGAIIDNPDFVG